MAIFRVEKNKNYTVMSNHHLKNKDLTLKSKGLLSLILSLPEEWNYTTRGLAAICREGVDCIGATLRELEKAGYIERNMLRDERGRITDTEYVIYEFPQEKTDKNPNEDKPGTPYPYTASPHTENPYMDGSDTDGADTERPGTEKPLQYKDTNISNTKKSNTKGSNTDLSNTHQSITGAGESFPQANGNPGDGIDWIDEFARCREAVKINIGYDILCQNHRNSRQMIDGIVEVMVDCLCVSRRTVKIGGAEYPIEVIREKLLSLDSSHIEYVIECMSENTTKIHQLDHYLLKSLYNAPATIDTHYQNRVNHDMANGFGAGKK